jgi:hypothetical protein
MPKKCLSKYYLTKFADFPRPKMSPCFEFKKVRTRKSRDCFSNFSISNKMRKIKHSEKIAILRNPRFWYLKNIIKVKNPDNSNLSKSGKKWNTLNSHYNTLPI